ncbi:hypothetical protein P170DRAFT_440121 [Aspergillus steynii IBT 23096]|uniref:DUF7703 domain-containing protein n=1 Tax=Aspergillus steynii IBT 23096 TaxID=1392250 RepID=A0A2I2FWC0_9EURO|nr:uncharacterized protein P170DRAFT_440121 [Aspergillus steynii IBT 23096]PLB44914.1 hypothetical protein P170DRAFT_440121 [Aspergillus steynii IBT 23096]
MAQDAQDPTTPASEMPSVLVLLLVSFIAIGLYNGLELFFWIFDFFKHRRGCYFWSMIISVIGLLMFAVAQIILFFNLASTYVWGVLIAFGYVIMSTALVMVLYSRLHLVTSQRISRYVLWLVIITTLLFPIPMQIIFFVGIFKPSMRAIQISLIYERLVVTVSCAREYIILGIYNFEAFRSLKPVISIKGRQGRRVRQILVATTLIIVFLDAGLLITEFQDRRVIKMTYSSFAISVKLKMEFAILNKLINLVQAPSISSSLPSDPLSSDQQPINPQSRPRSRAHSIAHACNPFRRSNTPNSRAENCLASAELGTNGTCTRTRRCTLDEYHESVNEQASGTHHTPASEMHTFVSSSSQALSLDELVRHPSAALSSGSGKGVVVTHESKC